MFFKVFSLLFVISIIQKSYAPPVTKNKAPETPEVPEDDKNSLEQYMEYHRYLKEVVHALESDPEFRKQIEQANEEDIRSGKIANHLEFVSHHVRTRLDEIKRTELERLRQLVKKKQELTGENSIEDPNHGHIDHSNPHTFEIEDLKKLILKTTEDLAEADRKRREEFKRYEMQKELEKMEKLNHTTGEEREKLERQFKEQEEKHKKHEPLHEPGHKAQLEEVWEKQDHMEQEFDPKAFFMMHDLDSNGLWDENEVKALFVKELDKMYAAGAPEDDMRERVEEMERMRETVFRDVDKNRDGFIDYHEFIAQTRNPEFQEDHGWQALDENKPYTDEELQEYIRQYQMQHPPPVVYNQGYHPNAVPQGYPNQGYPQQVPPHAYPQQVPPQGYPQQVPPQGYHPQQVPEGYPQQAHPNQMPPQVNQAPPQVDRGAANQQPPYQANQNPQENQIPQGNQIPSRVNQPPPQANQPPLQASQQGQLPQQQINSPPHLPQEQMASQLRENPSNVKEGSPSQQGNPAIQQNVQPNVQVQQH